MISTYSKTLQLFTLFVTIFAVVIFGVELSFIIIFKDIFYLFTLILSGVLSIVLLIVYIYLKTYRAEINSDGFTIKKFNKIKSYEYKDLELSKIKILRKKQDIYLSFINANNKSVGELSFKDLKDEQIDTIYNFLPENVMKEHDDD